MPTGIYRTADRKKSGFYGKKHSSYSKMMMSEGHKRRHARRKDPRLT